MRSCLRIVAPVLALALSSMAWAQSTNLITNGGFCFGDPTCAASLAGWSYAHGGWGGDQGADLPMTAGDSNIGWGTGTWHPSDQSSDPVAKVSVQQDPGGIHWIYEHLTNLNVGQSYTLSGKIAGAYGMISAIPSGTALTWALGYMQGTYDPSRIDAGYALQPEGANGTGTWTSVARHDFSGTSAQTFDWLSGSATFTAVSTECTVFYVYFANTTANWQQYGALVDEVSLTTSGCAVGAASLAYVAPDTTNHTVFAGGTTTLTITGSALDLATSVVLTPTGLTTPQVTGANLTKHGSAPNTYLTADFTLPTTPTGAWDLTVNSPACSSVSSNMLAQAVRNTTSGLVLNGDFESGDLTGWTTWGGNDNNGINGPGNIFGHTSPIDGSYDYGVGKVNGGGGPEGVYQQITLPAAADGEQYTLSWKWVTGVDTGTALFEVGVVPGFLTSQFNNPILDGAGNTIAVQNPAIANQTLTTATGGTASATVTFARPADGKITVYAKAAGQGANVNWALWLDDVSLVDAGTSCSPVEASTFLVTAAPFNTYFDNGTVSHRNGSTTPSNSITTRDFCGMHHQYQITGQHLDQVTGITLQHATAGNIVSLVLDTQTATTITAHTDAGPNGALSASGVSYILPANPTGAYNLFLTSTSSTCNKAACLSNALTVTSPGLVGVDLTGVRLFSGSFTTTSTSLSGDRVAAGLKGGTSINLEFFADGAHAGTDFTPQGCQMLRALRLVKHSSSQSPPPATAWFTPQNIYSSYDADNASGAFQRMTTSQIDASGTMVSNPVDLSGLTEAGYYDLQILWNNPNNYTLRPDQNTYAADGSTAPAFLFYVPPTSDGHGRTLPSNNGFALGEPGTTDGKPLGCPVANEANPRPQDWDQSKYGPPGGGGFKRDGAWEGPACDTTRNLALNSCNGHYAGIDVATAVTNGDVAFFQTLDASSLVDPNTHLPIQQLDVRAEMVVNGHGAAKGYINLYDGVPGFNGTAIGTQIAHVTITPTSTDGPAGLVTSPSLVASVPTSQAVNTGLLTVEFELVPDPSDGTSAIWVSNVRIGSYQRCDCNYPWADLNGDGYVDMADFALLQSCITVGSTNPQITSGCGCADSNGDGTIDVSDVTNFLFCASGSHVPWSANSYCP